MDGIGIDGIHAVTNKAIYRNVPSIKNNLEKGF